MGLRRVAPPGLRGGEGKLEDLESHFRRAEVVREYATFDFLLAPETVIFSELEGSIRGGRVLDVGVGAGRTTPRLARLAREYVGVDISEPMIETCRCRFGGLSGASFQVLDARDLRPLRDGSFDLVLFSFNGLDLVGDHASRLRALSELRRVCRPGGVLCFSSENLAWAEARFGYGRVLRAALGRHRERAGPRRRLRLARALLADTRRWRRCNPDRRKYAGADHALFVEERPRHELAPEHYEDPGRRIRVRKYYARPRAQVAWFVEAGFHGVRVFAPHGGEVTEEVGEGVPAARWLYYLGARSTSGGAPPKRRRPRPPEEEGPAP